MKLEITRTNASHLSSRMQAAEALAQIRSEWQTLAEGRSLLEIEGSIGLLLLDIADQLGFGHQERIAFLGPDLAQEIEALADSPLGVEIVQ